MRAVGFMLVAALLGGGSAHAQGAAPAAVTRATRLELDPLMEGTAKVKGSTDADKVRIRVYSGWNGDESAVESRKPLDQRIQEAYAREHRATIDVATEPRARVEALACLLGTERMPPKTVTVSQGTFEVTLEGPLAGGDCVVADDTSTDPFLGSVIVRSAVLDFGRLRAYFSVGGAVSQSRGNFSSTDTFIGFTSDSRIFGRMLKKNEGDDAAEAPTAPLRLLNTRVQVNGIVDARVGVRLTTGDAADSSATTGGAPAQVPFQRPDQLLFNWGQPGYLQLGLHAPISFKGWDWRSDGKLYSFYVSPLIKGGVLAFDAPVVVSRTVEIDLTKADTDTARYKLVRNDVRDGALGFVSYGGRIGIYGYDLLGLARRNRQVANDPIGYVDVAWGRSSAYRTYTFERTTNAAKTVETVSIGSERQRRLSLEGRMKIPSLPALIGFDVNIRSLSDDSTPNDFRFIAAFRIDAQKALSRIFGTSVTSGQ